MVILYINICHNCHKRKIPYFDTKLLKTISPVRENFFPN